MGKFKRMDQTRCKPRLHDYPQPDIVPRRSRPQGKQCNLLQSSQCAVSTQVLGFPLPATLELFNFQLGTLRIKDSRELVGFMTRDNTVCRGREDGCLGQPLGFWFYHTLFLDLPVYASPQPDYRVLCGSLPLLLPTS